jgi:hypothetical protein
MAVVSTVIRVKRARRGIGEANRLLEQAHDLFDRMMSIPTATKAGRAAKVRALLLHVMPNNSDHGIWRGPSDELEYDNRACRQLLAEFAGITEEDLANL